MRVFRACHTALDAVSPDICDGVEGLRVRFPNDGITVKTQ